MKEKVNLLSQEDILLFRTMAEHYQSENERIFFETMKYKEEHELAFMNDLLLTEDDNEDKLASRFANEITTESTTTGTLIYNNYIQLEKLHDCQ